MTHRSEARGTAANETLPELHDEASFRRALQVVLTIANERDIQVGNKSWKCVSRETDHTWDVEITTVETETDPGR